MKIKTELFFVEMSLVESSSKPDLDESSFKPHRNLISSNPRRKGKYTTYVMANFRHMSSESLSILWGSGGETGARRAPDRLTKFTYTRTTNS